MTLGKHLIIEFYGCQSPAIDQPEALEAYLKEACLIMGTTIVNTNFHQFSPYGVSGVVVIQESHLAVHTWPEHGFVALDFFTCNTQIRHEEALAYLTEMLQPQQQEVMEVPRGRMSPGRPAAQPTPCPLQLPQLIPLS
jgi:S-adenosylmethionine decarboxylase